MDWEPPKAKKGKKKKAKIVQEEASTSDVKPAGDESQVVSIPNEGDAEIASVPEELTPPEPKGTFNFIKLFYLASLLTTPANPQFRFWSYFFT